MTKLYWLNDKGGKLKGNGELLNHTLIYCLNQETFLSNKARSDYYTNFIIENSTDQRLVGATKSLLNLSKGSRLPLSTNDYQLPNDFGTFFAQKIADVRIANI